MDPLAQHPKYQKIKDLGQGTFGSVLHARNRETGEDVAIKLIALGEKFYQKYVDREIINHRQLLHPHVVAFKEVFVTPNYLCIVMEYQVPILKLCDFGYSKNMLGSVPKTRVGTAAYISPEVARTSGQAAYDTEKADVWSSAVTLYCMLAGCYPFSDANHQVHLRTIKSLTPKDVDIALSRLSGGVVSSECIHLLKGMLSIDPKQRYSLDQIMVDDWFKQFLPDLSKMTVAPEREIQSESHVLEVLAEAESLSEARRAGTDEFAEEVMDDVIDAEEDQMAMGDGSVADGEHNGNETGFFEDMTLRNTKP
ncbi:hypothetical protein Ndes2526A_g06498 [Nannochloris sp. 'desiccata']